MKYEFLSQYVYQIADEKKKIYAIGPVPERFAHATGRVLENTERPLLWIYKENIMSLYYINELDISNEDISILDSNPMDANQNQAISLELFQTIEVGTDIISVEHVIHKNSEGNHVDFILVFTLKDVRKYLLSEV